MISEPYSDSTLMPFGVKHIGKTLREIRDTDPGYFLWLWKSSGGGRSMSNAKLAKYIGDNIEGIRMDEVAKKQRDRIGRRNERI